MTHNISGDVVLKEPTVNVEQALLHIAFLFASPRFLRIQVPPYEEAYAQIEYRQEFNELAKSMLNSNKKIVFKHTSANVNAL